MVAFVGMAHYPYTFHICLYYIDVVKYTRENFNMVDNSVFNVKILLKINQASSIPTSNVDCLVLPTLPPGIT